MRIQLFSDFLVARIADWLPRASFVGDGQRAGQQLGARRAQAHEPDALGLAAVDELGRHQVVLGLGHAAQQRPDDGGVVAGARRRGARGRR